MKYGYIEVYTIGIGVASGIERRWYRQRSKLQLRKASSARTLGFLGSLPGGWMGGSRQDPCGAGTRQIPTGSDQS